MNQSVTLIEPKRLTRCEKPTLSLSLSLSLSIDRSTVSINKAVSLIDIDVNQALSKFSECVQYAGECMKKTVYIILYILPFLVNFFNFIFDDGSVFPDE